MVKIWIQKIRSLPGWMRNRYVLTALLFAVYMMFFDHHDMISQYRLKQELNKLETEKAYFEDQIKNTQSDLDDLLTNNRKLEKFAREKYLMKRDNEVIFVIVDKE
jgi:cell division protein FtsB